MLKGRLAATEEEMKRKQYRGSTDEYRIGVRPIATRKERALRLRDAVLEWLRGRPPRFSTFGPIRVLDATVGRFDISYRTPFSGRFPSPSLAYGLDIWLADAGKVMNLEWNDDRIEVVGFRGGEWEGELLACLSKECQ